MKKWYKRIKGWTKKEWREKNKMEGWRWKKEMEGWLKKKKNGRGNIELSRRKVRGGNVSCEKLCIVVVYYIWRKQEKVKWRSNNTLS